MLTTAEEALEAGNGTLSLEDCLDQFNECLVKCQDFQREKDKKEELFEASSVSNT